MKIQITMKDPDGVEDAISGSVVEYDEVRERDRVRNQLKRWFRFGEYATIEVDLEAGTARVLEVSEP